MKSFNYHSAKDVKEASKLASSSSVFLAGGMTTIPSMKLGLASYKDIIDIKRIKKLSGIKVSGKKISIGATTKHAEVANSKEIKKAIPSLAALAEGIEFTSEEEYSKKISTLKESYFKGDAPKVASAADETPVEEVATTPAMNAYVDALSRWE